MLNWKSIINVMTVAMNFNRRPFALSATLTSFRIYSGWVLFLFVILSLTASNLNLPINSSLNLKTIVFHRSWPNPQNRTCAPWLQFLINVSHRIWSIVADYLYITNTRNKREKVYLCAKFTVNIHGWFAGKTTVCRSWNRNIEEATSARDNLQSSDNLVDLFEFTAEQGALKCVVALCNRMLKL